MTTDLAAVQQLDNTLDLPERDRGAAEAVAAGLRDAKAENTRRAYSSAWRQFRAWAEAGGHPALPAAPQAVALYLGHLASTGRSIATVQQARSSISHFHAAAGMQRGDNPALHPVVKGGGTLGQWGAECQSVNSSTWSNLPPPITLAPGGRFVARHPGSWPVTGQPGFQALNPLAQFGDDPLLFRDDHQQGSPARLVQVQLWFHCSFMPQLRLGRQHFSAWRRASPNSPH